jgi:choline dehydrogenase-like flavoprotein
MTAFTRPELQHGYFTTPQAAFMDRKLPYVRGKGLGGSSVINFMSYNYGPSADYERWAEAVGDNAWRWGRVRERFKRVCISFEAVAVNSYIVSTISDCELWLA